MTNAQLAEARRAFAAFADVRPKIEGDAIIPIRAGVRGSPVMVTDGMSPQQVRAQINASIKALINA